jgi:hypothetical protein
VRNEITIAELYHEDGRDADAGRLEGELNRLLVMADADYPPLVRLRTLEASSRQKNPNR